MKCTNCKKNEATVFYREVINGKETKYALCPDCAAEMEKKNGPFFSKFEMPDMSHMFDFDFPDVFGGGLLGGLLGGSLPEKTRRNAKRCPKCNATFDEICNEGKAGCPECYEVFKEEFAPTLGRLHGNSVHRGRAPAGLKAEKSRENEVASLEKQLKKAVSDEKYEDAAVLRDRLRELRAQ